MGIEKIEQAIGEFRVVVVEPFLHAGSQERDSLQHPLHVRILRLIAAEAETARDLWVLLGEFARQRPQDRQLTVVVGK